MTQYYKKYDRNTKNICHPILSSFHWLITAVVVYNPTECRILICSKEDPHNFSSLFNIRYLKGPDGMDTNILFLIMNFFKTIPFPGKGRSTFVTFHEISESDARDKNSNAVVLL